MVAPGPEAVLQGIMLLGVLASFATAALARRHPEEPSARPLFWLVVFAAIWGGAALLEAVVPTYRAEVFFTKLNYVGIGGLTAALVVFALVYTGREEYVTPKTVALLAVEPVVLNVLVWTTERHGLVYETGPEGRMLVSQHGPALPLHLVYSYLLTLVAVALLLGMVRRQRSVFRRQSLAVVAVAVVPLAANAVRFALELDAEITPAAFSFSGLALVWAMRRQDLVAVSPIARDVMLADMDAGMVALNRNDVIVDVNESGREILGIDPDREVIGTPVSDLLGDGGALQERLSDVVDGHEELTVETAAGWRTFGVDVSPLFDHRDRRIGRLFLVHDVTAQKRRQRELERRNEQLDQFTSVVSHDLRNPINVADGYLDEAQRTGEDRHFEEVRAMHDRMERIIEDLLTLAREGEDAAETETVDLQVAVEDAWGNVDTRAGRLAADCGGWTVQADRSRLLRLLENLFRNAVEHGPDDVTVTVELLAPDAPEPPLERRGFVVADDGPGIPQDTRTEIFEHGYTTSEDGTGLGLSIVRGIAAAHGWQATVGESGAGGARFEMSHIGSLDLAAAAPADD